MSAIGDMRDRIAQLTADLEHERAAHERTKTELAESQRFERKAAQERDEWRAEAAKARLLLQKATADFESESRIYCAELAMMNPVVEWARKLSTQNKTKLQHGRASQAEIGLERSVNRVVGTAGRDLAARVTLWRELEAQSREWNLGPMCICHLIDDSQPRCLACRVHTTLCKLAALDEKGAK